MNSDKEKSKQDSKKAAPEARGGNDRLMVLALKDRVYRLHKQRVVIGSVISADVRLSGDGVSPIHAVLELSQAEDGSDRAMIYDLASDTGVFINGRKVVTQELKSGDQITVGPFSLKLSLQNMDAVLPTAPVRESEGRKLFLNPNEDLKPLLLQDERGVEEIFDYRPTNKKAVEVVMSWKGAMLDVEHFVERQAITIGSTRDSDFGVPPVSAKKFPLITRRGDTYCLNIDSSMKGVIQRKGSLQTFDDIRSTLIAGPNGHQVAFNKEDFAKISIGEVDFYASFTAAPPRLKRRRMMEKDPLFMKVAFSSMALTAVLIAALLNVRVPEQIEAEELPDRLATILYQPELYQPKPRVKSTTVEVDTRTARPKPIPTAKLDIKPQKVDLKKPIPKEINVATSKTKGSNRAQNMAKEGEGARAKGKEGMRGSPKAAPGDQPQNIAMRNSPQGGKGRGAGNSQVLGEGNVDLLKGASEKIQNLLGNSAANLGKGGDRLQGFGGFTTLGKGGAALSGEGKGGGGDAASLGGLGEKGRGGGRVGTGLGAAGTGNGIIGGKARVVIRSGGPEEAVIMGAIDAAAVEAALLAHRDEFRLCYEKEINAEKPKLAGRVGTSFVIGASGRVTQAGIASTTLKNANTESCVLKVIRRIDFPVPRGGGVVQVTYPFKFSPVGR